MKSQIAFACLALLLAHNVASGILLQAGNKKEAAAFSFADAQYFHRFTHEDQNEYTPAGQEDLNAWTDMMTTWLYPNIKDGEALAHGASAVLDTYKANRAIVVKTDSVPRTNDKPAEH